MKAAVDDPAGKAISSAISLGVIVGLPVLLAVANDAWLYSPAGHFDTWMFLGYGFHYGDPTFYSTDYKISRLPWILLEYSAHSLFSPIIANLLLQLGCLTLATVSTFFVVRQLFGQTAALVAAGFLAVYTHFKGAGGADYQNTLSGPLYALTFWVLTLAARAENRISAWFFAVGALYIATIHTNIIYINLAPVLFAHFWVIRRFKDSPRPSLLNIALSTILGAVVLTAFLGLINLSVGRDFMFFLPQFKLAANFVEDNSLQKPWWNPWSNGWYMDVPYLGALFAGGAVALIASVATWRHHTRLSQRQILALSINLQFLFLLLLWLAWQTEGQTALDFPNYEAPLIVPLALMIGANFGLYGREFGPWGQVAVGLVLAVCFTFPLVWPQLMKSLQLPSFSSALITASLYFALAFFTLLAAGRTTVGVVAVLLLLGIANAKSADSIGNYALNSCTVARDAYLSIVDAHKRLAEIGRKPDDVYVWFDEGESAIAKFCRTPYRIDYIGYSLVATGFNFLQEPWPMKRISELDRDHLREIVGRDPLVVVLSNNPDNANRLIQYLNQVGLPMRVLATERMGYGNIVFSLFLLRRSVPDAS